MIQKICDFIVTCAFRVLADRRILETRILSELARQNDEGKTLFVGTHWYTERYTRMFTSLSLITMDYDSRQARFGTAGHITDSIENCAEYFDCECVEAVVCNGVFGWGLNERSAVEQAFASCYEILKPGGWLIIGWNNIPSRNPFLLDEILSLQKFIRSPFPGFEASEIRLHTYNRHVFSFYQKPK